LPIYEGQINDPDSTDQVKQTVSQSLPVKRPKQVYEAKSDQIPSLAEIQDR